MVSSPLGRGPRLGLLPALAPLVLPLAALYAACGSSATATPDDAAPPRDAAISAADAGKDASPLLCVDGKPAPYPTNTKVDLLSAIPPLELPKLGGGVFALASRFEPCAPRSRVLLLRTTAAFCGPCLWAQKHTAEAVPKDLADRVELVDLVVSDKNNVRVRTSDDLARVERELGPHAAVVAADPAYTLRDAGLGDRRLPFYVLVDTRTMVIRRFLADPEPETLESTLRREIALLDGLAAPAPTDIVYVDGLFPKNHYDLLREMTLPGPPPPDPTNAVADLPAAAALGKDLFFAELGPGRVTCATCHAPDKGFADGKPRGVGAGVGDRNTPSVLYASHARFQFWDGRADTLWLQAVGPIENPIEIASSRLLVAHKVFALYKDRYEAVFGPLPPLDDAARFPPAGKPGDPAWDAMTAADKTAVNLVFARVGKLIEAYERRISAKPNALDRYIGGETNALTREQKVGLHTFFTAGCAQCHWGPRLTDDAFHNLRFATGRLDGAPDEGASLGLPKLVAHELRKPEYADGPFQDVFLPKDPTELRGAFRTPPLRGITKTAPYGHGGDLGTLADVSKHYGTAGLKPEDPRAVGATEPWVPNFVEQHQKELTPLLELLDGDPIAP